MDAKAKDTTKNKKVMSLVDHLGELRGCLLKSLLAVLVFFAITLFFSAELINTLKAPLAAALPAGNAVLHFTGPLEVFMASIKTSFLASFVLACPVWLYQFWRFIEPALYANERRYILPFIFASVLLFIFGVAFSYFVILPLALDFLLQMGLEVGTPVITISDYLSLLTVMILGFGIIFETPLILILLSTLEVITAKMLADFRRYVVILVLFIGAVLTPPDPLSQIGMAIPLYLMYETAIIVIRILEKKRAKV